MKKELTTKFCHICGMRERKNITVWKFCNAVCREEGVRRAKQVKVRATEGTHELSAEKGLYSHLSIRVWLFGCAGADWALSTATALLSLT